MQHQSSELTLQKCVVMSQGIPVIFLANEWNSKSHESAIFKINDFTIIWLIIKMIIYLQLKNYT